MKVPVRNNFQVLPGGRGGGRVAISQGADTAGLGARQAGAALGAVSGVIGEQVQREQARVNQARVREGALQLRDEIQKAELEYQQYKGAELVAANQPIMRDFDQRVEKRRNEILNGLNSDDARFAFEEASAGLMQGYSERARQYEAQQAETYIEQQRDGVIVAAFENATRDPARRVDALSTASETINEKLRDQGYDGDRLRQMSEDHFAKMMATSVDGLIESGDTAGARNFLDSARPYLSASAYAIFNEAVSDAESAGQVLTMADQVFADFPPSDFGRTPPLAKMYARARNIAGDDPDALKALMSEVQFRAGLYEQEAHDAYGRNFNEALSIAMESPARVSGVQSFKRLDAKDRNAILGMVERSVKGEKVETDRAAYANALTLIADGRLTDAQQYIRGNPQMFSDSDFKSLMGKAVKSEQGGTAIESLRSLSQIIDDALASTGMSDEKVDAAKGSLLGELDRANQRYQRIHGSEPDDTWIQSKAAELAAEVTITKPGWFNDKTFNRYALKEIDGIPPVHVQAVLSVYGDAATIPIEVMQETYAQAVQILAANGLPNPTDTDIEDVMRALRIEAQSMGAGQ